MAKEKSQQPERISIIGVPVSAVTVESALTYIHENLDDIRGEYICAANVYTTVVAHDQADYWKVQNEAVLSLPDGKPLSFFGRKKTEHPMDKVSGISFMQSIFTDARFAGKRHFFYGTHEETLNKMIPRLQGLYPELVICGYEPSVFRELKEDELEVLAEQINAAEADFIWVALGAPRQEQLMNRMQGKVCGIMCGVGGAFNIWAGIVKNAPVWMQNAGLEWVYRLIQEPKRLFRRYLTTNTKFIYYLLKGK